MNKNRDLFKLNTDSISFEIFTEDHDQLLFSPQESQSTIEVTNLTYSYLALRIMTNHKKSFIVTPSYFILGPVESKIISVIYQIKNETKGLEKTSKFKFEGFTIGNEDKSNDPKILFSAYMKKGKEVEGDEVKVHVSYIISVKEYKMRTRNTAPAKLKGMNLFNVEPMTYIESKPGMDMLKKDSINRNMKEYFEIKEESGNVFKPKFKSKRSIPKMGNNIPKISEEKGKEVGSEERIKEENKEEKEKENKLKKVLKNKKLLIPMIILLLLLLIRFFFKKKNIIKYKSI